MTTTKAVRDLSTGEIFIDPDRSGRRPAKVVTPPSTEYSDCLKEDRTYLVLSDWSGFNDWSHSYEPDTQVEIIGEKEAIDQTVKNRIEHRQLMYPAARAYHDMRFAASNPII